MVPDNCGIVTVNNLKKKAVDKEDGIVAWNDIGNEVRDRATKDSEKSKGYTEQQGEGGDNSNFGCIWNLEQLSTRIAENKEN